MNGLEFVKAYQEIEKHVVHEVSMRHPEYFQDEDAEFEFRLAIHVAGVIIARPLMLTSTHKLVEFEIVIITMDELNEMCAVNDATST